MLETTTSIVRLLIHVQIHALVNNAVNNRISANGVNPQEKTFPDSAVRREISNLKVVCENAASGCNWTGVLKNYSVSIEQTLINNWHMLNLKI